MPSRKNTRGEEQFNVELPKELMDRLNAYCDRHHVAKKLVVTLAVTKLLNEVTVR